MRRVGMSGSTSPNFTGCVAVFGRARVCTRREDVTLAPMKLGEMLVRDGRITQEQLEQALARQARDGGRFGTVLAEMQLIDLDSLTVYLGLELGIPIATRATMDRAKKAAVRLLTAEQASNFRCVPIIVQDRQLIAAIDDPHDLEVLDEISRITGYRVIPRVAPEIRIFQYLELYYGVPRPARYADFVDTAALLSATEESSLPAPPLPGLPPPSANPIKPPPRPHVAVSEMPQRPRPRFNTEQEELRSNAEELVSKLDSDEDASAEQAPRLVLGATKPSTAPTREFTAPEEFEALDLEAAIQAMNQATQRGEVANAIMSYAVNLFDVAALCIIRDNMAFGWKAGGPNLDRERIEALLIPLDAPSMFRIAIHNNNMYHAAPPPGTLQTYLYRVLRCRPPGMATVASIAIRKRVVNLLYGHRSERDELSDSELDDLRRACKAATDAYVRLIAESKKSADD